MASLSLNNSFNVPWKQFVQTFHDLHRYEMPLSVADDTQVRALAGQSFNTVTTSSG